MDPSRLAHLARRSLGDFCYTECNAYCCRKGSIRLSEKNVGLVTQGKKDALLSSGILTRLEKGYVLSFEANDDCCPSLRENLCTIHSMKGKPGVCGEFPIFLREDVVEFCSGCLAVRRGKFYPFIRRFLAMGLKVVSGPTTEEFCLK